MPISHFVDKKALPTHIVHWGLNPPPPQKHHPFLFAKPFLKSASCPSPPFGTIYP